MTTEPEQTPEERIAAQLPAEEPKPPHFESKVDDVEDAYYSTQPPELIPIALMKAKYCNGSDARVRAEEIAKFRGLKIWRFFETGRAWVAQCYVPIQFPASKLRGF